MYDLTYDPIDNLFVVLSDWFCSCQVSTHVCDLPEAQMATMTKSNCCPSCGAPDCSLDCILQPFVRKTTENMKKRFEEHMAEHNCLDDDGRIKVGHNAFVHDILETEFLGSRYVMLILWCRLFQQKRPLLIIVEIICQQVYVQSLVGFPLV